MTSLIPVHTATAVRAHPTFSKYCRRQCNCNWGWQRQNAGTKIAGTTASQSIALNDANQHTLDVYQTITVDATALTTGAATVDAKQRLMLRLLSRRRRRRHYYYVNVFKPAIQLRVTVTIQSKLRPPASRLQTASMAVLVLTPSSLQTTRL